MLVWRALDVLLIVVALAAVCYSMVGTLSGPDAQEEQGSR